MKAHQTTDHARISAIENLIEQLTLDEKLLLLGGTPHDLPDRDADLFGVERIGLPRLRFADGPVGVHWWAKASTCYPALICLAASFDEATALLYGQAVGTDCRAAGVHVLLAPGVNLYRSPLCGRNFEYMGEDPELAGKLSAAYIRGVQEKGVSATVKHFAANNQEYNRYHIGSDVDERTLREVYLRPFELAVKEGKTGCVMTSYNPINGVHASENKALITDILREDWKFEGVVMSDWVSTYSTAQTLNAGLDLEMPWANWLKPEKIKPLLASGVVSEETINQRIRNRLKLMERFGWLDPEHNQKDESLPARNHETEAAALEVARRGIVLLKNDKDFLPRKPEQTKKIAILGHHAGEPILCGGGSAYTSPHESITLVEAIRNTYGEHSEIEYYPCVHSWHANETHTASAFLTESGEPGLQARYYDNKQFAGEPVYETVDQHINLNPETRYLNPALCTAAFSAIWTGQIEITDAAAYDFYMYAVDGRMSATLNGEPLFDSLHDTYRKTRELSAGRYELTVSFRQTHGPCTHALFGYEQTAHAFMGREAALEAIRDCDLVVIGTGYVKEVEGESHDRPFEMDERLNQLIVDAAKINPNIAVALYAGGACDISPWIDRVKGVLNLWYPGQNGTVAAAEILAGITNPSGKLPFTWEERPEDRGSFNCYHDDDGDQRVAYTDGVFCGYRHFDRCAIAPRYPFGHGLSYTTFVYENLRLTADTIEAGEEAVLKFDLVNTGSNAGSETALVFVGDKEASVERPPKELKAIQRICLEPGERKTVQTTLPARAFAFWNIQQKDWCIETGEFVISIGPDAQTQPLQATLNVL